MKSPSVCVLYVENFPKRAEAALDGKVNSVFQRIDDLDPRTVTAAIVQQRNKENAPTYIMVDVPNNLSRNEINSIAFYVMAENQKRACNVAFGTVKNPAADDANFYAHEHLPIVKWDELKNCQRFTSDEIVQQQYKQPKQESLLGWLVRLPGAVFKGLHL